MKGGEPVYTFSAEGYLESVEDESGNKLYLDYDSASQLGKVGYGSERYIEFTFNLNGKIRYIRDHAGRQVTYTYDGYGNLSSVEDPEKRVTTYKYESLNPGKEHFITSIKDNWGRIIAQIDYYPDSKVKSYTEKGETSTYVYSPSSQASGGIDTSYLHGIGIDEPVMMDRAGAKYYYFRDGMGSIREMTDSGGTVQNSYSYGAWGEVRITDYITGPGPTPTKSKIVYAIGEI